MLLNQEVATGGVLSEKVFLEISQNSWENTYSRISFLIKLQTLRLWLATLLKKSFLAQVFSCEFCEASKNIFFTKHHRTTASVNLLHVTGLFPYPTNISENLWLYCSFMEIAFRHGCSPVNLLHSFRAPFLRTPLGGCFCTCEKPLEKKTENLIVVRWPSKKLKGATKS